VSFQGPNDPGITDPRDRSNLQPSFWQDKTPPTQVKRDKNMAWSPNLVLDAQEWIQRAALGDPAAVQEVVFTVAPALLTELKKRDST